ncbi:DUF2934 domain-containing protein [Larsenimonas rhizosphaerae]|uniref:DUF2934 domain-containing protein n=1 Tax=Larsenimonas rhizosphaerae TaxID=2944682 RepID=A0AA41ZJH3_9GAMM|nr:DUF2934 domain-containing protein [Larsenimonas rhizosphaerae]MCM2130252.1 DUF2934 domain-containing protein [Larsenimonas rhizosphaerae]MCX2522956.1 DUF2934 domain-containing protein [Larsenimonas rhizosphaerae]
MADDQLRIRLLAYRIWESEGCPDGQSERHWQMASRLVAAERITDLPKEVPQRFEMNPSGPKEHAVAEDGAAVAVPAGAEEKTPAAPARAKRTTTSRRSVDAAAEKDGNVSVEKPPRRATAKRGSKGGKASTRARQAPGE